MPRSLPAEATIAHASAAASTSAYETSAYASGSESSDALLFRKIAWRIVPFLFLCYVVSFLDRINIGFAQLQMKHDLGFSDAMYGLGAAVFYVGYSLWMDHRGGDRINHSAHLAGAAFGVLFMVAMAPGVLPLFLQQLGSIGG